MKINRVTMTGADDSIKAEMLEPLTARYPFVEWGVLLSRSSEGRVRFPSRNWLGHFGDTYSQKWQLAGHLCGSWVRDLVLHGEMTCFVERPEFMSYFPRIQLNFHGDRHEPHKLFWERLRVHPDKQFIFQLDHINDDLLQRALEKKINAVAFFDISHGAGIVPESWPAPIPGVYCGYAGGLGPENIRDQLKKLEQVVGDTTIWIDMESSLRSVAIGKNFFDLYKCEKVLEIVMPWIKI